MYKYVSFLILLLALINCTKKEKSDIDISDISVKFDVNRFDQEFYTSTSKKLPELKSKYPYLFPAQNHDSIWLQKIEDTDEQELYAETQKVFSDFSSEKEQIETLFKHIKFYYPNFKSPKVITLLSNVDYETKVVYADSLLFVSLDVYLGKDNKIYQDYPNYIKQNFTKEHLIVDVANAITNVQILFSTDRTFVSRMVQQGKKLYLLDAYVPKLSDAEKIGYTQEQIEWAEYNDEEVWKYFIENKILFSTEQELSRRFIDNAPFSKFYRANDNETPGSIGVWFGWQIVRAFMQNTDTSLQEMLQMKNDEIFKKSKYKPSK